MVIKKKENNTVIPGNTISIKESIRMYEKKLNLLEKQKREINEDIKLTQRALFILKCPLPFEIDSDVMFEVPNGRTKLTKKCKLELEYDGYSWCYYARPYTFDGTLSSRHFIIYHADYVKLKPVEE